MKIVLLIIGLFLVFSLNSFGQWFNNFDPNRGMIVNIDYSDSSNVWQIADAAKFHNFVSCGNFSLLTDSVNDYQRGDTSYANFQVDSLDLFHNWPFVIFQWINLFEFDTLKAGGWIEISYDSGANWNNVFTDTNSMALYMGPNEIVSLDNGEMGFTGNSKGFISTSSANNPWTFEAICWSMSDTSSAFAKSVSLDFRFVFWSDTIAFRKAGWAIDDLSFYPSFIDNLSSEEKNSLLAGIKVSPNPVSDELKVLVQETMPNNLSIEIYDLNGIKVNNTRLSQVNNTIDFSNVPQGLYIYKLKTGGYLKTGKLIKN